MFDSPPLISLEMHDAINRFIQKAQQDDVFQRNLAGFRENAYEIDSKNLEHGPLNKNSYTYQFEQILKIFLYNPEAEFSLETRDGETCISIKNIAGDLEEYNLSKIIQYMNYDHLTPLTALESTEILEELKSDLISELSDATLTKKHALLSELQQRCIHHYTTDEGYIGINNFMRGKIDNIELEDLFLNMFITHAISTGLNTLGAERRSVPVVARGVSVCNIDKHRLQRKTDGTVWMDKGFLSTGQKNVDSSLSYGGDSYAGDSYPFIVEGVNSYDVAVTLETPVDHESLEAFALKQSRIRLFIHEGQIYCSDNGHLVHREDSVNVESHPISDGCSKLIAELHKNQQELDAKNLAMTEYLKPYDIEIPEGGMTYDIAIGEGIKNKGLLKELQRIDNLTKKIRKAKIELRSEIKQIGLELFKIRPQIYLIEGVMGWDISFLSNKSFEHEFLICPMQGMTVYTKEVIVDKKCFDLNYVIPVRTLNGLQPPEMQSPSRETFTTYQQEIAEKERAHTLDVLKKLLTLFVEENPGIFFNFSRIEAEKTIKALEELKTPSFQEIDSALEKLLKNKNFKKIQEFFKTDPLAVAVLETHQQRVRDKNINTKTDTLIPRDRNKQNKSHSR